MAEGKTGSEPEFAALVGIDWADRKHVWCLQAAGSRKREAGELEHKVETVDAWVAELCRRFGYRPIAVAVEQVKGALVFLRNKYECLHIFPVPSTMTAKMREALYPRELRTTRGMRIYFWTYWGSIGTSCTACRQTTKPPAECRIYRESKSFPVAHL